MMFPSDVKIAVLEQKMKEWELLYKTEITELKIQNALLMEAVERLERMLDDY